MLALFLDFEDAKNIHALKVLICSFGGCWRFLTGFWHIDLDLDMVPVYDAAIIQILTLYLNFEGKKNIHVQ